jgi:probable phosphoglycerate mutase
MIAPMGELILLRHGQTEWSAAGRHTGRTDIPLTPHGAADAAALAPVLARFVSRRRLTAVFTSPARRAVVTAELAGLGGPGTPGEAGGQVPKIDPDLWEWDYGGYEGRTTAQIQSGRPGWYLWRDGVVPGDGGHPGETVSEVGSRVDRVLKRAGALLPDGDVALVAHGHVLRVLTARWLGLPPAEGRLFRLDTGTVSTLGTEHAAPVIITWNVPGVTGDALLPGALGGVGAVRAGLLGDPAEERGRADDDRRGQDLRLVVAVLLGEERG